MTLTENHDLSCTLILKSIFPYSHHAPIQNQWLHLVKYKQQLVCESFFLTTWWLHKKLSNHGMQSKIVMLLVGA